MCHCRARPDGLLAMTMNCHALRACNNETRHCEEPSDEAIHCNEVNYYETSLTRLRFKSIL